MGNLKAVSRDLNIGTQCSFCGNDTAIAYWMGAGDPVTTCKWCAIDILPKFIADAVCAGTPPTHRELAEAFRKVRSEFYYAAALALCRKENA